MRKLLKWNWIILGGLVVLLLVTAGVAFAWTEAQFNRTYNIQSEMLLIASDHVSFIQKERFA